MEAEAVRYQFDSVEVQPAAFAVLRDGRALSLEPKALRVLLYLIEHRDRAVGKDELIHAVWEGTAVTDNALTRIVAQLRRELGDHARQARYIQTLPTLGYRFIADLTIVPSRTAAPPPVPKPQRNVVLFGTALLLVLILAGAAWLLARHGTGARRLELHPVQLTTSPSLDIGGSFSPDGKSFTYSSNRTGWFEIYERPVNPGGAERQVTTDGKQNVDPAWSPDGKSIAYRSVAQHGIWVIPVAGGTPRRLAAFGSAPAWSPDGRWIAFRSAEPFSFAWFDLPGLGDSTIWIVAADGSQLRQITQPGNPAGQHAMPGWSADGKFVVFFSFGTTRMWVVDIATGRVQSLPGTDKQGAAPAIGALQGSNLYFFSGSGRGEFGIYRFRPSVPDVEELYSTGRDVPLGIAVSPDGKRLLYTRVSNISQLWSTDTDGTGWKPIYEDAVIRVPSFSPDGQRLAYIVQAPKQITFDREGASFPTPSWDGRWIAYEARRGDTTQVAVIDRDGGHQEILTDDQAINWANSWSSDNRRIAYAGYRDGVWNLYWIDRVTRERKQITRYTAYGSFVRNPAWRPGTEQVVYEQSQVKGNVYLLNLP